MNKNETNKSVDYGDRPFGHSEGLAMEFKRAADRFTPFPKNPTICRFMLQPMTTLRKETRNDLSRTVLAARELAEQAAVKALHALGVDEADAPEHLDNAGRLLRRRLRAQAKQLGDREDPRKTGCYQTAHLAEKLAYDHWHRLLFARFLAENDLLISPDHGVGVSLSDCEELAPALGLRDGWEVAASFAARMLPQIFRPDDPADTVVFAPEDRAALRTMVTGLSRDTFLADDALGWVYQFWQAKRKEEVNRSGGKIGADEISPVTQLFTEDYMVQFLLHNTLGAWWAGKQFAVDSGRLSVISCPSEEDARKACALPGCSWEYLRFVRTSATTDHGSLTTDYWRPAAGTFDGWPKTAKELRVLDPCMGSGHFLVFELPILVAMRRAEEGLSTEEAVEAVLRDNLFGLEIDPRCTQIAAFNLALAAWKLIGGYRQLPPLNLACCGLGINARKEDWLKLANGDTRLRGGMEQLFDLFQKAPELGSLIDPRRIAGDLLTADFHELLPLLEQALAREDARRDETLTEMGVTARGLAQAAEILAGQFTLVATNVPYLGRGKQDDVLKDYCERFYTEGKADLATCFILRCIEFCAPYGKTALVTPQNWLFLGTYRKMREQLLDKVAFDFCVRLGPKAFQTPMWDFNVLLLGISKGAARKEHTFFGCDAAEEETPSEKALAVAGEELIFSSQNAQLGNPDARITLGALAQHPLLQEHAESLVGIQTGDYPRFIRSFWELSRRSTDWDFYSRPTTGGLDRSEIIFWERGNGSLLAFVQEKLGVGGEGAWLRGEPCWGNRGIAIQLMAELSATIYEGQKFDQTLAVILPKHERDLPAIWAFASAPDFTKSVRAIDQKLNLTNSTLAKVPFDLTHWQKVAAEKYPHGLPKPFSSDPTQWLFNGHPAGADQPLHVAMARLLGYRWPRQTGSEFPDCPALGPDGLERFADADGIVCISAIKGEQPAAERLRALLAAAFGSAWTAQKQAELLAGVGYAGKTLDDWLRNAFFEQDCQLFHHRPFIWHLWDGLRDGFSALVNYHKLNRSALEKLTYTYLGDWIGRQKAAVAAGEEGSDAKLAAAQRLQAAIKLIIEGEAPYDIFVRWKPLEKQPIGWEPDLNDGVRLNIRPFLSVPDVGKRGVGILRWKPNIKWDKDRGKDVPSAPWYKLFNGDRINDHHLTLAEKREARDG